MKEIALMLKIVGIQILIIFVFTIIILFVPIIPIVIYIWIALIVAVGSVIFYRLPKNKNYSLKYIFIYIIPFAILLIYGLINAIANYYRPFGAGDMLTALVNGFVTFVLPIIEFAWGVSLFVGVWRESKKQLNHS